MKKLIGLAVLPVMLAATPMLALAEQNTPLTQKTPTQKTGQKIETKTPLKTQTPKNIIDPQSLTTPTKTTGTTNQTVNQDSVQGVPFAQAQVHLINRQYPEAISGFQSILAGQPENVAALNSLATALYHQGRYIEATQAIEKAITLDPVNSGLFLTQAKIEDAQGKSLEALQSYLTFTAMNPNDGAALQAQQRAGELYKTHEAKLSPAEQNLFQGQRLLSLRQPTQAIPLFEKYQSMAPNDPQASLMLGQAYLELGQPGKAIPQFESAVKLKADNAAAYYHLGSSYDLQGQPQNARQAYEQFVKFAPQSESAMLLNKRVEVRQ